MCLVGLALVAAVTLKAEVLMIDPSVTLHQFALQNCQGVSSITQNRTIDTKKPRSEGVQHVFSVIGILK